MSRVSKLFYDEELKTYEDKVDGRQMESCQIHPSAWISQGVFIGKGVEIGENVLIHPGAVILSYSKIGEGSIVYPNVTLYQKTHIGKYCRIHAGAVIGADGFGYHHKKGTHHKLWHMGGVFIEDHVEIGANTSIDGGTFTPTFIGEGSKIDGLVQIGHNCRIGRGVILCGQVGISGSVKVGDYSVFGGKAGCAPNLELGAGCQLAGGSLNGSNWPAGSILGGHPSRPLKEWMRCNAYLRKAALKK